MSMQLDRIRSHALSDLHAEQLLKILRNASSLSEIPQARCRYSGHCSDWYLGVLSSSEGNFNIGRCFKVHFVTTTSSGQQRAKENFGCFYYCRSKLGRVATWTINWSVQDWQEEKSGKAAAVLRSLLPAEKPAMALGPSILWEVRETICKQARCNRHAQDRWNL